MIRYRSDLFGLRTLFIWSGSAVSRALVPALVSTLVAWIYWEIWKEELQTIILHTYVIAVLIGFFGFLLTTRLNFAYQRWWEALSMCHTSTSKFVDSAVCLASCHYQTSHLWKQPKSYGDNCKGGSAAQKTVLKDMRLQDFLNLDMQKSKKTIWAMNMNGLPSPTRTELLSATFHDTKKKAFRWFRQPTLKPPTAIGTANRPAQVTKNKREVPRPAPVSQRRRTWSVSELVVRTKSFTPNRQRCISQGMVDPQDDISDFLEEMVHLYSLLNAVAMASLRHDVEGSPSPLCAYRENLPLPPYNCQHYKEPPVDDNDDDVDDASVIQKQCFAWYYRLRDLFYFLAGLDSSPKQRTLYNAGRPFSVLGGISEAEAVRLQMARGPMAQVALCQLWLKEFIAREHLQGSTGATPPPTISRVFRFMSEGIAAYHHCRNVAYAPFPFVHEQLTRFFTFVVVFCFPCLYVGFVNTKFLAFSMNFVTMLCFQGIYEVARELSNPYHTVPNDLPLNLFHAQFNESLRTLLTGFHPDSKPKDDVADRWLDSSSPVTLPKGHAAWMSFS